MFTFLYNKFTQDNMYQIVSRSVRFLFCRLYIKKKNILVFYRFTVYIHGVSKNDIDVAHYNMDADQLINSFLQRCCWESMLSNGDLLSGLS